MVTKLSLTSLLTFLVCFTIVSQNTGNQSQAAIFFKKATTALQNNTDSLAFYFQQGRLQYLSKQSYLLYKESAVELAKACFKAKVYQEGVDLLLKLKSDLDDSELANKMETKIDVNYQLARGYHYLRDHHNAIKQAQDNLAFLDSTSISFANHHNIMGLNYFRSNDYVNSIKSFEQTLKIRRAIYGVEDNRVATVLNNLGNSYYWQGILNKASQCYQEGLKIRTKILGETSPRLFSLLNNLANVYSGKGEIYQSIKLYQRAISLLETQDDPSKEELALLFSNLSIELFNNGAFKEAEIYQNRAKELFKNLSSRETTIMLGDLTTNQANHAIYLGDFPKGLELQREAIEHYQKSIDGFHIKKIRAKNNLGFYYNRQGSFEDALKVLLPTLEEMKERPEQDRIQLVNLLQDSGDAFLGLNKLAQAEDYHQEALTVLQTDLGQGNYRLSYSYNQLSKIAKQTGDTKKAFDFAQQALASNRNSLGPNREFSNYEYYLESLLLKADLLEGTEAIAVYKLADQALLEIKAGLISVEDKMNFANYTYQVSEKALASLSAGISANKNEAIETAFQFSERSKANVLSQLMAIQQGKNYAGIPADSIRLEEQLQSDVQYYKALLSTLSENEDPAAFQNELFAAQRAYSQLIEDFSEQYPAYYALKHQNSIPSIKDIQASLDQETALVSYLSTADKLYIFLFNQASAQVFQQEIDEDFIELLVGLRKTITKRLNDDYVEIAQELHSALFPFELGPEIKRLILVPDGALGQIPFEVLLSEESSRRKPIDFAGLSYLIKDYQISYVPSVSLFIQKKQNLNISYENELLAYAPVFTEPQPISSFAAANSREFSDRIEILRNFSFGDETIDALPATEQEIEEIAEVFDQNQKTVKAFLFAKASEDALKNHSKEKSRFVHIATHGFVNEDDPERSGLLFYPDSSSQQDHILYTSEIYNLPLTADLVTLSACETGLGENLKGEGLLGLSRAFLFAGVPNLMVSLWKVQDEATSKLMVDFYKQYWQKEATQYGPPLRQAKLQMIKSKTYSHPYYWSPFILIGQ